VNHEMFFKHVRRRYMLALALSVMMWVTNAVFDWVSKCVLVFLY
jgi:hypothetical protein